MIRVLLVEDDKNFGQVMKDYLEINGFKVQLAVDGNQGYSAIHNGTYDVCILDIMMPYRDGFSLAEEIKKVKPNLPFIFLTAKSLKEDTIKGYKLGADDFLNKPFDAEVLLYKLRALIQRKKGKHYEQNKKEYDLGAFKFHPSRRTLEGKEVKKLSPKESALLKVLVDHVNQVVPRHEILTKVWGEDTYFNGRSMDVYITKLRKHLSASEDLEIINIHGEGYRLVFEGDSSQS